MSASETRFVELREVILRVLADCRACFVARIGDGPSGRLAQAVNAYPYGAIEESMLAWFAGR